VHLHSGTLTPNLRQVARVSEKRGPESKQPVVLAIEHHDIRSVCHDENAPLDSARAVATTILMADFDHCVPSQSQTYPRSLDGHTYAVNPSPVANSAPIYRFYNKWNGSHFYTASVDERDAVIAGLAHVYEFEGPVFWIGQ
jgi:hypothetical protein